MSTSALSSLHQYNNAKIESQKIPTTPSDELSLTLAGITLNDDDDDDENGQDDQVKSDIPLSSVLEDVSSRLTQIKNQFFIIQEKRHAGVFALAEQNNSSPSSKVNGEDVEKSVALDVAMSELNSLLDSASEGMKAADSHLNPVNGSSQDFSPRRRTGSIASLSSLDSFDDAFLEVNAVGNTPKALSKRYENLSVEWTRLQAEAKNLEEELKGDKYLLVFTSIREQMEGMMDSLDKALNTCHDFIFSIHKERAENVFYSSESQWTSAKDRLAELVIIKRSFDVKKRSYGPACEQMFITMEKGLKQRSTKNGTVLRQLADLKSRWRGLRESVAKIDKDLTRIEADLGQVEGLHLTPSKSSPGDLFLTPPSNEHRPKSRLRGKNDSATNTPTGMNRSISIGDIYNKLTNLNSKLSLSPASATLSPQSVVPVKPPKSVYRHSFIEAKGSTSAQQTHSRSYSSATPYLPPVPNTRTSSRVVSNRAPSSSTHPYHVRATPPLRSTSGDAAHFRRTPLNKTGNSDRFSRADSEPPNSAELVLRRRQYQPPAKSAEEEIEESLLDVGDVSFSSTATLQNRPPSVLGLYDRPPSAAGLYYRPPSSSGHRAESEGISRIPRLSTGPSARNQSSARFEAGERPGSALSQSSAAAFGKSPSAKVSYTRSQYPPSSFHNNDRGNRLSMMTPEPAIAARAQRMSLFVPKTNSKTTTSTPAKRLSRPPVKFNGAMHEAGSGSVTGGSSISYSASPPSSSAGASPSSSYRTLANTTPLNINKRRSMQLSSTGRTTPLSAAALAKIPHAGPDLSEHLQNNGSSSVANYRSQREGQASSGRYTPSIFSGRETPTFSDKGSVFGFSRRTAAAYSYRANPNDLIDVEVGKIVNSLGLAIERVDPPLPKNMKDMTPSSSKIVRYEVGSKMIACKVLQLVSLRFDSITI